ncbi:MAG: Crp/Fnr family transcriptional regulator [Lachnospiraceae bacterium]|nr:Crp/Fnr family transcriptional regulator [Lachnospiraceae bacterium]
MDNTLNFSSPWIDGDLDVWSPLTHNRKPEKAKKEFVLYHQGDKPEYVYLVMKGRLRITSYQPNGKERQIYIAEKGCLVGEKSVLLHQPHTFSAVAIVDSLVYKINVHDFFSIMEKNFNLCQSVMQMICKKQEILYHHLLGNSFSQASQQIARVILHLVKQYGEPVADTFKISIRFTHQDVAHITGISRVTVSNTFSKFTNEGILDKQDSRFIIRDLDRLQEYADGEQEF